MKQKRTRKSRLKIKKLVFCIFFLVLFICGLVIGLEKAFSLFMSRNSAESSSYYLLIGTDPSAGNEADSIMLAALNNKDKKATFISIPPNTRISRDNNKNQLLKSTFVEGGSEETRSAVENLLHLRIDKYAVLNYSDFRQDIDNISSLNMYIESSMYHEDKEGNTDIDIHQGYQALNGEKALGYVRYLSNDKDEIERIQHQERLFKTVILNLKEHFALYNWLHFYRSWTAAETNISYSEAAQQAYNLTSYPDENFKFVILPGESKKINKVDTWIINPVEVQKAIALSIGSNN